MRESVPNPAAQQFEHATLKSTLGLVSGIERRAGIRRQGAITIEQRRRANTRGQAALQILALRVNLRWIHIALAIGEFDFARRCQQIANSASSMA